MADVERTIEAMWPTVQASIRAAVDEAVARANQVRAVPGIVASVDDSTLEVDPPAGMGDPMYATVTDPATAVGDNTLVLFLPDGSRLQIGRVPG